VVSAAQPPGTFVTQRAIALVVSDAPQTRTVHVGRSDRQDQETHGYCPRKMTLSLCYMSLRSSARMRRLAACMWETPHLAKGGKTKRCMSYPNRLD
jgi:hypothetical protein